MEWSWNAFVLLTKHLKTPQLVEIKCYLGNVFLFFYTEPDKDYGLQPNLHMIPPSFKQSLKPVEANIGETAVLHCHIIGKPMPSLSWFHNDNKIQLNGRVQLKFGEESGKWELHVLNTIPEDSGVFRCVASNPRGEASTEAALTVVGSLRHAVGESSRIQYVIEEEEVIEEKPKHVYVFKEPAQITESIVSTQEEIVKRNDEIDEFRKIQRKFKPEFEVEENMVTETKKRSEREVATEHFDGKKSYEKKVWEHDTTVEETSEPNVTGEIGEEGDLVLPVEGPINEFTSTLAIEGPDAEDQNLEFVEVDMSQLERKEFPKEGKLSHATRAVVGASKEDAKPTKVMTKVGKDGTTVVVETVKVGGKESSTKTITKTTQKDVQWKTSDQKEVLEMTHEQIEALMQKGRLTGGAELQVMITDGVPVEVKHQEEGSGEQVQQTEPTKTMEDEQDTPKQEVKVEELTQEVAKQEMKVEEEQKATVKTEEISTTAEGVATIEEDVIASVTREQVHAGSLMAGTAPTKPQADVPTAEQTSGAEPSETTAEAMDVEVVATEATDVEMPEEDTKVAVEEEVVQAVPREQVIGGGQATSDDTSSDGTKSTVTSVTVAEGLASEVVSEGQTSIVISEGDSGEITKTSEVDETVTMVMSETQPQEGVTVVMSEMQSEGEFTMVMDSGSASETITLDTTSGAEEAQTEAVISVGPDSADAAETFTITTTT